MATSGPGHTVLAPARSAARATGLALTRLTEFAMVAIAVGYVLVPSADSGEAGKLHDLHFLVAFDVVASLYLVVGFFVVRRASKRPSGVPASAAGSDPARSRGISRRVVARLQSIAGQRLAFALAVVASFFGLVGAFDVVDYQDDTELGPAFTALGVVAVICAWMLLQVGYARFYSGRYHRQDALGGGLSFPDCPDPGPVEFLYLSFTLGVSFAVSDVEIRSRRLRWHVMIHVIVSFFYNAAVLAIAISTVTGK